MAIGRRMVFDFPSIRSIRAPRPAGGQGGDIGSRRRWLGRMKQALPISTNSLDVRTSGSNVRNPRVVIGQLPFHIGLGVEKPFGCLIARCNQLGPASPFHGQARHEYVRKKGSREHLPRGHACRKPGETADELPEEGGKAGCSGLLCSCSLSKHTSSCRTSLKGYTRMVPGARP